MAQARGITEGIASWASASRMRWPSWSASLTTSLREIYRTTAPDKSFMQESLNLPGHQAALSSFGGSCSRPRTGLA